jgi:(p)ppGpp synthase/HD superfamily hydrolase
LTIAETDALAAEAHAGQRDKVGAPYIEHVRAVAHGLVPLGDRLVQAGLLHDIIEDTGWTLDGLRTAGVPAEVVELVNAVTNKPGVPYADMIRAIARNEQAALVKIADNAHNSLPSRTAVLPAQQRAQLDAKYRAAREVLWPAVDREQLRTVVARVNPGLLDEI